MCWVRDLLESDVDVASSTTCMETSRCNIWPALFPPSRRKPPGASSRHDTRRFVEPKINFHVLDPACSRGPLLRTISLDETRSNHNVVEQTATIILVYLPTWSQEWCRGELVLWSMVHTFLSWQVGPWRPMSPRSTCTIDCLTDRGSARGSWESGVGLANESGTHVHCFLPW